MTLGIRLYAHPRSERGVLEYFLAHQEALSGNDAVDEAHSVTRLVNVPPDLEDVISSLP